MSKFQIGDRVAVYGWCETWFDDLDKGEGDMIECDGDIGVVIELPSESLLGYCGMWLKFEPLKELKVVAHPKQCRRLKPKKKSNQDKTKAHALIERLVIAYSGLLQSIGHKDSVLVDIAKKYLSE